MKRNILFALPMSVLAIACPQQESIHTTDCKTMTIPPACTGNPADPKININVAAGLVVAPPNVCAKAGTDVEFKITPANTKTIVATVPKVPANTWLSGINIPDSGGFKITVPALAPEDAHYDYHIVATNGYCYDPRITVR